MFAKTHVRTAIVFGAAILAAGSLASSPVSAQIFDEQDVIVTAPTLPDDIRTAYVRYDDLNLLVPSGQNRLEGRVRGAVRSVCPIDGYRHLRAAMDNRACVTAAWSGARPQMAAAIANARNGYAERTTALRVAAR